MNPAIKRLARELAEINGDNLTERDSTDEITENNAENDSEIKAQPLGVIITQIYYLISLALSLFP